MTRLRSILANHPVAITSLAFAVAGYALHAAGGRFAAAQFVAVSILSPVAARLKRSGKVEEIGDAVGELVDEVVPGKVERPAEPTCKESLQVQLPPKPVPPPPPPPAEDDYAPLEIIVSAFLYGPAMPKPKPKKRKRK